jgi:hypothetical protein
MQFSLLLGLENLEGLSFVAINLLDGGETIFKALAKFQIVQLVSEPVHFDLCLFVHRTGGSDNLDLERDLLTKLVSVRTAEAEHKLINLI